MTDEKINFACNPDMLPFTKKAFKIINKYRPGLEFQMMYSILITYSAAIVRGRGLMLIDTMGKGKGCTIKATTHLYGELETIFVGRITDIGFLDIIKHLQYRAEELGATYDPANINFELRIEDLSVAAGKENILEPTMTTASLLVSDKALGMCTDDTFRTFRNFIKDLEGLTVRIKSMATIFGATPEIRYKIKNRLPSYGTMVKDRETEYYAIMSRLQNEYIQTHIVNRLKREGDEKDKTEIDDMELREMLVKLLPSGPIPEETLPFTDNVSEENFDYVCRNTLRKQHTDIRASKYLKGDLSALAYLNRSPVIENRHIAFYMLYYPNISVLHRLPMNIQALVQTCNKYESLEEAADAFDESPEKIMEILSDFNRDYGNEKNPLEIEENKICLKPDFNWHLINQQQFISKCIGGRF